MATAPSNATQWQRDVLADITLHPMTRVIAMVLWRYMDADRPGQVWCTHARITELTSADHRTIRRAFHQLVAGGYLVLTTKRTPNTPARYAYRVLSTSIRGDTEGPLAEGTRKDPSEGTRSDPSRGDTEGPLSTEHIRENPEGDPPRPGRVVGSGRSGPELRQWMGELLQRINARRFTDPVNPGGRVRGACDAIRVTGWTAERAFQRIANESGINVTDCRGGLIVTKLEQLAAALEQNAYRNTAAATAVLTECGWCRKPIPHGATYCDPCIADGRNVIALGGAS